MYARVEDGHIATHTDTHRQTHTHIHTWTNTLYILKNTILYKIKSIFKREFRHSPPIKSYIPNNCFVE